MGETQLLSYASADTSFRRGRLAMAAVMLLLHFVTQAILGFFFVPFVTFSLDYGDQWWFEIVSRLPRLAVEAFFVVGVWFLAGVFKGEEGDVGRLRRLLLAGALLYAVVRVGDDLMTFSQAALGSTNLLMAVACIASDIQIFILIVTLLWMRRVGKHERAGWVAIVCAVVVGFAILAQLFSQAEGIEYAMHPVPDVATIKAMSADELRALVAKPSTPVRRFLENGSRVFTPIQEYSQIIFWTAIAIWAGRRRRVVR